MQNPAELFNSIHMLLIDLDGTLLNNDKSIGEKDFETLQQLGEKGVIRVFATGRNFYSASKVLKEDDPFDYLVFSSGAGIFDWNKKQLLFSSGIENSRVLQTISSLKKKKLNFSVHFPIPDNHKYYYYKGNDVASDFEWRNSLYSGFNYELKNGYPHKNATQFIVILNNASYFDEIAGLFPDLKIIRATSPIDGKSVWLEIFNKEVSKANGGKFLCKKLGIKEQNTLSLGNDYNDLDLLAWTRYSYLVENAPDDLKGKFNQCVGNQDNPLSYVYNLHWH